MTRPFMMEEAPFEAYSEFDPEFDQEQDEVWADEFSGLEAQEELDEFGDFEFYGEEEYGRRARRAPLRPSKRLSATPKRSPKRPPPKPRPVRSWPPKVTVGPVVIHPPFTSPAPEQSGAGQPADRLTPDGPPESAPPVTQASEYVRWVQDALNRVMDLRLPVDGIMSPATRSGLRSFQARERLTVSGIAGPDTERALIAALAGARPGEARETGAYQAEFGTEQEIGANQNRDYIRWIQQSLNKILGLRLAADGVMGPKTRSAIRSFQQKQGLTADGAVGPRTEAALIVRGAGKPPGAPGRSVIEIPPVVICTGKPDAVLDEFGFDAASLRKDARKDHFAQIDAIAREIVARWLRSKPVLSVCLVGHTDPVGSRSYNFELGVRRSRAVKDALCVALAKESAKQGRPDIPGKMTIAVTSSGEDDPVSRGRTPRDATLNRRVQVFLLDEPVPGEACAQPQPPDRFDLDSCMEDCDREFQRCRETAPLNECRRKRGACRRNCRGIPV